MIRLAQPKDLDKVYEICLEALKSSAYSHIPENEHDARQVFASIIISGSAWVTDNVDGVLLAYLQPMWFNNGIVASTDLIFYVRDGAKSEGLRLAKQYIKWSKENADVTYLTISFGGTIDRTEKLYSRLGFERIGGTYILRGE